MHRLRKNTAWLTAALTAGLSVASTGCPFDVAVDKNGQKTSFAIDPTGSVGLDQSLDLDALVVEGYWELANAKITIACLALDNTVRDLGTTTVNTFQSYRFAFAENASARVGLRDQCGTFYDAARAKNYKVLLARFGTTFLPILTRANGTCILQSWTGDAMEAAELCLNADARDGHEELGFHETPREVNKLKVYLPTPGPAPVGPVTGLSADKLGLVINDADPYSVAIGEYYRVKRGIPAANIVHVQVPVTAQLTRAQFAPLKAQVDAALSSQVQAIAVAWTSPSRVECNSLTHALSRGFDATRCPSYPPCKSPGTSPYYNSASKQPFTELGFRPSMMLAAPSIAEGRALIDRGVASDGVRPRGRARVMDTSDSARDIRGRFMPQANLGFALSPFVNVSVDVSDTLTATTDTLFYFQGLARVSGITTNTFPPGAVADHLTSYGGMLTDSSQMSALEFISAGATGTFGTVSEPCAFSAKFPDPSVMIKRYASGETLIEAYWKSVNDTVQGVFVGDPLANPWRQPVSP